MRDVIIEAGISSPDISGWPPLAAQWADPNVNIPNWRSLGPNEKPEPGDVAAYKLSGGGRAFSGHTGIITSDGAGGISNISAHDGSVYPVPGQFGNKKKKNYRRYTGE